MAGTQMQQRRDTAANWTTNNKVLAAGEIGLETDTRYIKLGNGSTPWNSLPYIAYLPAGAKAVDSELLDGYDSSAFVLGTDVAATPTASKVARRQSDGRLKAATATEDDDLLTFLQFKGSGRYRGSGATAFPNTDLVMGDTYLFSGYGRFVYTGSSWRQLYPLEITESARNALATTGAAATAALYVGFKVYETDTRRIWQWGGATPGWEYMGGGIEPTFLLTVSTPNFNHYSTVNVTPAANRFAKLIIKRKPGGAVHIEGLVITGALSANTFYTLVSAANLPTWARPKERIIRYFSLSGAPNLMRLDVLNPDSTVTDAPAGTISAYPMAAATSGTIFSVDMQYQTNNAY